MRRLIIPTLAALTLLGAGLLLPNRADAVPLSAPGSLAAAIADNAIVQETRWRRWGWRRCWGCRRWGWRRHWRWRYSDVDLKQDVVQVGKLDNGIGLYRFSYKGDDHTAYVRVMAQEVQTVMPTAVARGRNGYLLVNYDRLGFQMMTWEQWLAQTGVRQPVQ